MDSKENNQFYIKYRYSNSKNKKDIPSIDMDFDPLNIVFLRLSRIVSDLEVVEVAGVE